MVTGIVFIKAERRKVNDVANSVAEMDGVSEVYSMGGTHDLIAVIRVRDNERLAELVTERLHRVDGILDSETHLALKVYSRHDLESMFSIGLEK